MKNKITIIALGGSIMVPDQVDWQYLKKFRKLIEENIKKDERFIVIAGGGRTARNYQDAAHKVGRITDEDKDWIGIHSTRLNAHLLRTIFRDLADPTVIDKRFKIKKLEYPITIASGWQPGWSTDYIAVALAVDFQVPNVIIAGKPSYVYTKDNQKYPDAKALKHLNWMEYCSLIPKSWSPGLHAPVDPIAADLAQKKNITVYLINGQKLKNFTDLFLGQKFTGTTITD